MRMNVNGMLCQCQANTDILAECAGHKCRKLIITKLMLVELERFRLITPALGLRQNSSVGLKNTITFPGFNTFEPIEPYS